MRLVGLTDVLLIAFDVRMGDPVDHQDVQENYDMSELVNQRNLEIYHPCCKA